MQIRTYMDHLKPGEQSQGGPWCYTVSRHGHVFISNTGFHSEEEALKEAEQHVK